MKEELIISGRMNPGIDPYLNIWHWHIPVYLFLGGLAAGILFFAALYTIMGREKEMPTAVKWATFLVPGALVFGLMALFFDLKHQLYFWQLYTTVRFESPMSWGAWVLMFITPLSMVWAASYIKEAIPTWEWRFKFLDQLEALVVKYRKALAWTMLALSIILGIYTGILLSAFNARPLWNTSILGPLFLVSGMSTGAAVIMWMSKNHMERRVMSMIDLVLIIVELFFIVHLFMGFLASTAVQIEAAELFLGGPFTVSFWVFVVILGLIFPAILEILELRGYKIPVAVPALLILFGGLVFRFIMVEAGQVTRYLY
ncbi:MAG: NrfD/PsrC family molybdoenzyme membrane anchor subunit [Bacteroidales bacterium]|jgi:formate-dependent nitrite reductase membrane component NrfD|nr:NrfD/PsrC family molybdoenzyme membrane anchor subunit [Bacteroidales bacterium]